jgi:protein tyrosine phosphatase (PTP) superfamily phosphohydrolase (DUF442 family)
MIRRVSLAFAALVLVIASGCKHRCCLNESGRQPTPFRPQAPNSPYLLPPAGVPTTPLPGASTIVPGVAPVVPTDPRTFQPPPAGGGRPAPEVLLPEDPPVGGSSRSSSPGDPAHGVLGDPARPQTPPPPQPTPARTTGLPGFVKVKDGVASGRKPTLEGFDALKQAGYRTAVYLHPAGADLSAARDVAEKRGLRFVAIETTPEKLAEALAEFNAALTDRATRPVYVYDEDGVRAGAVWYLHFRTAEAMNDDAARVRARPLGLTDQTDDGKAFALATQRILETR